MSKKVKTPAELIRELFESVCSAYQEDNDASVLASRKTEAEKKKLLSAVKGKITRWNKKLAELLPENLASATPNLPGMEEEPKGYTVTVFMDRELVRTVELTLPNNLTLTHVPYTVVADPVPESALSAIEPSSLEPLEPLEWPQPGPAEPGAKDEDNGPAEATPGPAIPHDLVVQTSLSTRKQTRDKQLTLLSNLLGTDAVKNFPESIVANGETLLCNFLHFSYASLEKAAEAEKAVTEANFPFVMTTHTEKTESEPPIGPAREKIELHVAVKAHSEQLQQAAEDLDAALDLKRVEVSEEDEAGATVFFEFDDLMAATQAKLIVEAMEFDFVENVEVYDPFEARFGEGELAGILSAPRSLVTYTAPSVDAELHYCTRCIALGHVEPGEDPSNVQPHKGASCSFCGWAQGTP